MRAPERLSWKHHIDAAPPRLNSGSIELTAKSRYAFLHQQQIVVDSGARLLLDVQLDARGRAAQDDAQLVRRRRLAALQGLLQQTKERVRMRLRYVIDIAFDHDLDRSAAALTHAGYFFREFAGQR